MFHQYSEKYPELASSFNHTISGEMPNDWESYLPCFTVNDGPVATRVSSGKVINCSYKSFR